MKLRKDYNNITYNGETHSLREWEQITGVHRYTIYSRLQRGWSIEDTLNKPVDVTRRGKRAEWRGIKNEPLTEEQITDEAALSIAAAVMRQIRKDLKMKMKRGHSTRPIKDFFDTPLCAAILGVLEYGMDGKEVYDHLEKQIRRELKW